MKERDMKVKFAKRIISYEEDEKMVKKLFLKMWMEDPECLYYEKIDFIPDTGKCPKTTYNIFTGFNAI